MIKAIARFTFGCMFIAMIVLEAIIVHQLGLSPRIALAAYAAALCVTLYLRYETKKGLRS